MQTYRLTSWRPSRLLNFLSPWSVSRKPHVLSYSIYLERVILLLFKVSTIHFQRIIPRVIKLTFSESPAKENLRRGKRKIRNGARQGNRRTQKPTCTGEVICKWVRGQLGESQSVIDNYSQLQPVDRTSSANKPCAKSGARKGHNINPIRL